MGKFKVGDRVVLARPDGHDTGQRGLSGGEVGVVARIDDSGWPWVEFDERDMQLSFLEDQLDILESTSPPQRDDRRERIATAVLAGFASDSSTVSLTRAYLAREAVKWADALIAELDR